MNFKVSNKFIYIKLLITILYIILELYFIYHISVDFKYMGYVMHFSLQRYLITKFIFLIFFILSFIFYKKSQFLYSIFILLIFLLYIPNAILYAFMDIPGGPFYSTVFFHFVFLSCAFFKLNIRAFAENQFIAKWFFIIVPIMIIIPITLAFGRKFNINNLIFKEIYETRLVFSELSTGIIGYLYNWAAKLILPLGIVFFMIRKEWLKMLSIFVALLYLFAISGNKLVYLTTIIMFFFHFIGKDYSTKILKLLLVFLILFAVFPLIDYFVLKNDTLKGTFVNRVFFFPALLNHFYFDMFKVRSLYFAETSFFNWFVDSPYSEKVGFAISKIYFHSNDMYANNGIISDGYMNLGYLGVIIFSFLFAFLFVIFNSLDLDIRYYGIYFSYVFIFISAPFFTNLITGGIIIFIILGITILRRKKAAS